MRERKLFLIAIAAFSMLAFSVVNANAAADWFACTVSKVGPGGSIDSYVMLNDTKAPTTFTAKWFRLDPSRSKEMLAVALAAITNNMKVWVYTDPAQPGNPLISTIYVGR